MIIDFFNQNYLEYTFGIFVFNIFAYLCLLTTFFLVFFLFDLRFFKTLNELKGLSNLTFIVVTSTTVFLSMAGIPPLFGFVSKFLLFLFFFFKKQFFLMNFLIIFNFFALYFYIQNIRFLIKKNDKSSPFIIKINNIFWNFSIIKFIIFFNFLNLFGFFFYWRFFNLF